MSPLYLEACWAALAAAWEAGGAAGPGLAHYLRTQQLGGDGGGGGGGWDPGMLGAFLQLNEVPAPAALHGALEGAQRALGELQAGGGAGARAAAGALLAAAFRGMPLGAAYALAAAED